MPQLIWIIAYFILELLTLPSTVALTIKRDCVFGPVNEIFPRRQGYSLSIGPKKTPNYNPHPGYEPYWPGGEWVFERFDVTTEKPEGSVCGHECPELYLEFGEVCGKSKKFTYKTFTNYCELLNEDCTGRSKWMIVYRGKCQEELKTYPATANLLVTRADEYLSKFFEENPTPARPKG